MNLISINMNIPKTRKSLSNNINYNSSTEL